MGPLTAAIMKNALLTLSRLLEREKRDRVTLVMGGGGAMILAHGFPLATADVDAVPKGLTFLELDPLVKEVAEIENIPADWLNPYFSTFAHTLPSDYGTRLITVLETEHLLVQALGAEDLLIMKCFAHRRKDVGHARALLRKKPDLSIVEARIDELESKAIRGAIEAREFLHEVEDLEGESS